MLTRRSFIPGLFFLVESPYRLEIEKWRKDYESRLKTDRGWLTVAGLFWLKEGENRFGADPSNDIVLPAGAAPAQAGVFEFRRGKVTVTMKDPPGGAREMRADTSGAPDPLTLGDLTMHVIQQGARYGIRLRDKNSRLRREFRGLSWFAVRESYRVKARFVAYAKPKEISIANILGDVEPMPSPGYAVFSLNGEQHTLHPVTEGDKELFFIFRDQTSGKETYPACRFLYSEMPRNGSVILDFNKAENPPCAYTPYATCPLPPRQNHLSARIEAGEKNYHVDEKSEARSQKSE